jgi:hypothetical protein
MSAAECEEHPEECAARWEQMQVAAIEYCEAYPDECNEVLDYYAQSFDTDAEEAGE